MFNFNNWKKHATFYFLLAFCVSLLFVKNAATHRGKHNILHTNAIQHMVGGILAGVTVHDGLEYDRWVDHQNPIYISTNLHPLGKYLWRDIEWTDGYTREFWDPQPPKKIEFWLRTRVTGFGVVEFSSFKAEAYGQTYGPEETEEKKVGFVVPLYPTYHLKENYEVYQHLEGPNFDETAGTYEWTASGKVKIKPYTYGIRGSIGTGVSVSFGWSLDGSQEPTPFESEGTWVVEHRTFTYGAVDNRLSGQYRCEGCSEKVSTQYAHRISCANPQHDTDTKYYFCLQTKKWEHLYEEVCSHGNCADTDVYRCTHTHNAPSPPDYSEDPPPPDIAGVCGHNFQNSELTNHAPAIGSCGHVYSPCTPGNHNTWVHGSCPSLHAYYACQGSSHARQANCSETDANGNTCTVTNFYPCDSHTHQFPTTTVTYTCGIHSGASSGESSDHKTTISGWSGSFYECQPHTNFSCGHTDLFANAAYHAPRSSCTQTNANGQSCTVTNFYDCAQHTHVYPAPTISCGRSGCTQTVSSSTQHSATCASGHSYWTCKPSDVKRHITRTCRFSECGKSWQRCMTGGVTPICDKPWRKQNGLRCWQIY